MENGKEFEVVFPTAADSEMWAEQISQLILEASQAKNSGLAQRSPEHIRTKIRENKAVLALKRDDKTLAGFCYIDTWQNGEYVVTSGLIVKPEFRGKGIATLLKKELFNHARKNFSQAKIFGLTTSGAVIKINSDLGYRAASYADITTDKGFWKGCETCANYDILQRTNGRLCLCTAMLYNPNEHGATAE